MQPWNRCIPDPQPAGPAGGSQWQGWDGRTRSRQLAPGPELTASGGLTGNRPDARPAVTFDPAIFEARDAKPEIRMPKSTLRADATIGFPVTPWNKDLELDEPALRTHARHMANTGLDALCFCGSNGEQHGLDAADYQRVCDIAGEVADEHTYLIVGVGQSWKTARWQAEVARRAGASAVLCIAPYAGDAGEAGLAEYYRAVADAAGTSVILYQTRWSGVLPLSLLERLASVDNIQMVKDENGNLSHYMSVRTHFGDRFRWINGMAEPFVPSYWNLGVHTFTSGLACFMPHVTLHIRELARKGDFGQINAILDDLVLPMYELRNRHPGYKVSMIKAAMELAGFDAGAVRPPLIEMNPVDRKDLSALMARHNLLAGGNAPR